MQRMVLRAAVVAAGLVLVVEACSAAATPPPIQPAATASQSPAIVASQPPATSGATSSSVPSASSSAPPPGALDACSLLMQTEVAAATAKPVGPGVSQNDGKQCQWVYMVPGEQLSGLNASLSVDGDPTAFSEDQKGGPGITAVSGVGDEAYFVQSGIVGILSFRKGSQLFDVAMNVAGSLIPLYPTAKQQAVETQMALAALPRIP